MNLHFDKVIPHTLNDIQQKENGVWNTSFSLSKGEKIILSAESGKGKTTFVHLLAGIRKDYEGTIRFDEKDIRKLSLFQWTQLRAHQLSFIFQDLQLFGGLSVEENLVLKNERLPTFTNTKLKEMIAQVDLEDKWNTPCNLLSFGQQQRVAIVRALIQPFDWLIMDEPFSHLDEKNKDLALTLILNRINELQAGMILTSLGENQLLEVDKKLYL